MTAPRETRPRETLEERVARLGVKKRDCRACPMFVPSPTGLAFGWCNAHEMYVKLYHPPGGFWSQCQFKALSRARGPEEGSRGVGALGPGSNGEMEGVVGSGRTRDTAFPKRT